MGNTAITLPPYSALVLRQKHSENTLEAMQVQCLFETQRSRSCRNSGGVVMEKHVITLQQKLS